jgi:hypothetical protein
MGVFMSIFLSQLLDATQASNLTAEIDPTGIEITGGYVSDLLSDVMGNVHENQLWITIMRHLNVIAVASLAGVPAVIFPKGLLPDDVVVAKAAEERVCLLSSPLPTFDIAGILYQMLHP